MYQELLTLSNGVNISQLGLGNGWRYLRISRKSRAMVKVELFQPPLVKNTHFIIGGADPLLRHVYNLNPNPVLPSLLHLTHSVAMHFHPS